MTTTRFSVEKQATIDPVELTAANVQAAFARGDLTAEALTQAYLDRIALYNPRYVALITINDDALRDAREIDRRRPAGEPLGPLAGVPIVVKDTMDMAGFPSTGGWRLLGERAGGIDLIPATDSCFVATNILGADRGGPHGISNTLSLETWTFLFLGFAGCSPVKRKCPCSLCLSR
jgi:hypothetical protein